ncbi:MAG: CheR family methyltransferase [Natronospirillum sp.]
MHSLMKAPIRAGNNRWLRHSALDDVQFEPWRKLLEERTGIQITASLRGLMDQRLRQRMAESGYTDLARYYAQVTAKGITGESEWQALVNALTVQETRFFRDPYALDLVADHMKAQWSRATQPLNLWSVGCSTGEEAYSLAMIMAELARHQAEPRHFAVTGSDISAPAIQRARLGRFSARALAQLPAPLKERYFAADRADYLVREPLARTLCFTRLNILSVSDAPLAPMDLVYCQNVLIYFRRWRRREIALQLVEKLSPGGMLVFGPGELPGFNHPDLVNIPSRHCLAFLRKHGTERVQ